MDTLESEIRELEKQIRRHEQDLKHLKNEGAIREPDLYEEGGGSYSPDWKKIREVEGTISALERRIDAIRRENR